MASAEDALREIPEAGNQYPENRMYGALPSYAFYLRHAKNIRMNNIKITQQQADGRPAFILDDVHDSDFNGISATNSMHSPVFSLKQNCTGILLNQL